VLKQRESSVAQQPEPFTHVLAVLDRLQVEYCIGGSVASSIWGRPRLTADLDVALFASYAQLRELKEALPQPDYYFDLQSAVEAAGAGTMVTINHVTGVKIDLFFQTDNGFANSQMSRRRRVKTRGGLDAFLASPEDVVLNKLKYFKEGKSEKHLIDIAEVLKDQATTFDMNYTGDWALRIGVRAEWEKAQQFAEDWNARKPS